MLLVYQLHSNGKRAVLYLENIVLMMCPTNRPRNLPLALHSLSDLLETVSEAQGTAQIWPQQQVGLYKQQTAESTGRANSGQLRLWPHELLLQRDWFEHSSHSYPSNSHRQCTALTRFLNCSCRSPACHVFVYVTYTHNLIYFEILMPIDFEFVQNCLLHSYALMRDRRLWHVQQLFQLLNAEAVKSLQIIKMFLFLACENSLYCKCTVQLLNLNKHLFFQLRLPEKCRAQASALRAIHSSSVSTSELW